MYYLTMKKGQYDRTQSILLRFKNYKIHSRIRNLKRTREDLKNSIGTYRQSSIFQLML